MGGTKIEITSVEIGLAALLKSKFRMTIVDPLTIPYSAGTQIAIPIKYDDLLAKNSANDLANGNVAAKNRAIDLKYEQLRKQENSYFTVVFLKVKDGIYPETILVPFGIPAISRALPYNVSEIAAEGLVGKMLAGNNNIVSLSLPLMIDYNYADTAAILAEIVILKGEKIALEVIAEGTESALAISEQAAKDLIVIMLAELDLYYLALKDGALHDACRNWGVLYEADKIVTELSIKAKFAASGLDANGATFHVGKALTARGKAAVAGVTATIMANGVVVLSTTQEGEVVITGKCVGCVDIVQTITIVPGTNQAFNFAFVLV
jgi:hypothetical protein